LDKSFVGLFFGAPSESRSLQDYAHPTLSTLFGFLFRFEQPPFMLGTVLVFFSGWSNHAGTDRSARQTELLNHQTANWLFCPAQHLSASLMLFYDRKIRNDDELKFPGV